MLRRPHGRRSAAGSCPVAATVTGLAVLVGATLTGGAGVAHAGCVVGRSLPGIEADMVRMVNAARADAGVRPLAADHRLRRYARRTSASMARGGEFRHDGMRWVRGGRAAQNIAQAPAAGAAFRAMLASPAHRRNILGPAWRSVGVGAAGDCRGSAFFTLNFSSRRRG